MICYEKFVKDYNNLNITTHEVRRINRLNSREYRKLRKLAIANGDIPESRHMNSNGAKFYYRKQNGDWTVQKQFANGEKIYVGDFPDESTAKLIRDKCLEVNWDLDKIRPLIDEKKTSNVKNYSLINGYWVIQKTVKGVRKTFLAVKHDKLSENEIKEIVRRFRNVEWDIECIDSVLDGFNIY